MIHALKTLPQYFEDTASGLKNFEVRIADRPFSLEDYIALNEWSGKEYTGRCTLHKIAYILDDPNYCKEGYVVLGLEPCCIVTHMLMRRDGSTDISVPIYGR